MSQLPNSTGTASASHVSVKGFVAVANSLSIFIVFSQTLPSQSKKLLKAQFRCDRNNIHKNVTI